LDPKTFVEFEMEIPMEGCDEMAGLVASAVQVLAEVIEQEVLAKNTYRLRIRCPEIAQQIVPGQFFMIRDPKLTDPMLGRPFALLDTWEDESGQPQGVDFGYVVVGKMTKRMATWKLGDQCEIWGPLGNGFAPIEFERLFLVAGGIGQTPFLAVAKEALGLKEYGRPLPRVCKDLTLCYGVRSKDYLAGLDLFDLPGLDVRISTDDGSFGHHGYVSDILQQDIDASAAPDAVLCCGPEPMMTGIAEICSSSDIPCWLSLETPMACGFGICFSCVTEVKMDDGEWDYRRTCVEGPVFPAQRLRLGSPT
jgi:dihydroorotate dehydrogenase electron transfer subunit